MAKGYTRRVNGKRMKNIQFKYAIDEEAIQFIMEQEKVSFSKAEQKFKDIMHRAFMSAFDHTTLAVDPLFDRTDFVDFDRLNDYERETGEEAPQFNGVAFACVR